MSWVASMALVCTMGANVGVYLCLVEVLLLCCKAYCLLYELKEAVILVLLFYRRLTRLYIGLELKIVLLVCYF